MSSKKTRIEFMAYCINKLRDVPPQKEGQFIHIPEPAPPVSCTDDMELELAFAEVPSAVNGRIARFQVIDGRWSLVGVTAL